MVTLIFQSFKLHAHLLSLVEYIYHGPTNMIYHKGKIFVEKH